MDDIEHQELLSKVVTLYYEKDLNQNEVGKQLGLSRAKVYRFLKEARERQIVQISISRPTERDTVLEQNLVNTFKLERALVFKKINSNYELGLRNLGEMVARYLESILKNGMTISVCLGQSTYEVINAVRPGAYIEINVAQAMGSIPFSAQELDSSSLVRQLASKLGGQFFNLPSPLMATSPEAASVLRSQPYIENTLKISRNAEIALIGIGSLNAENSHYVQSQIITAEELNLLKVKGAVGDISGKFIDIHGQPIACLYNECFIGLSLEELKNIPNTIAVSMGEDKTEAIYGALKTGVVNTFCTDQKTAHALLNLKVK